MAEPLSSAASSLFGESRFPSQRSIFSPQAFGRAVDIRQRAALSRRGMGSTLGALEAVSAIDKFREDTELNPLRRETAALEMQAQKGQYERLLSPEGQDLLALAEKTKKAEQEDALRSYELKRRVQDTKPQILQQLDQFDVFSAGAKSSLEAISKNSLFMDDPDIASRVAETASEVDRLNTERGIVAAGMRERELSPGEFASIMSEVEERYRRGEPQPAYSVLSRQKSLNAITSEQAQRVRDEAELRRIAAEVPQKTIEEVKAEAEKAIKGLTGAKQVNMASFLKDPDAEIARIKALAQDDESTAKDGEMLEITEGISTALGPFADRIKALRRKAQIPNPAMVDYARQLRGDSAKDLEAMTDALGNSRSSVNPPVATGGRRINNEAVLELLNKGKPNAR